MSSVKPKARDIFKTEEVVSDTKCQREVKLDEEGNGYPLQYCWASLGAQSVKNLPAMQETWV